MNPRVTILICNHNYGSFLKETLNACSAQKYENFQIVVIDDGSTDNSVNFLKQFIPADYNTKNCIPDLICYNGIPINVILQSTCTGPSDARNIGIRATIDNTDAYLICDADDIPADNKLSRMVEEWGLDKSVGVVYADYYTLNSENGQLAYEYKEPYSWERLRRECIVHSNALITSYALKAVCENGNYYDPNLRTCEDWDLWGRIGRKFIFKHIAEPLTTVTIHPGCSSSSVSQEIWNKNWHTVYNRINPNG